MKREMIGKRYIHSKLGVVEVIKQPNYEAGGPRNILVQSPRGKEVIVPQRSLRRFEFSEEELRKLESEEFRIIEGIRIVVSELIKEKES